MWELKHTSMAIDTAHPWDKMRYAQIPEYARVLSASCAQIAGYLVRPTTSKYIPGMPQDPEVCYSCGVLGYSGVL